MNTIKYISSLIIVFGVMTQVSASGNSGSGEYKFGVFPYLSAARMDNIYAPVSAELSKSLNHQVKFRTSSTFKKFLTKLKAEYYDIALIQPFWYPVAVDQKGYIPLLKMKEPFVSLIMTLDDSKVRSVEDLRGKIIATPPAFVPVVHMARRALIAKGLVPGKDVTFKAFKSVDSCFQQVLIAKASACIAPPFAPAVFEKAMNIKLRTILKSPGIPNLALVIHPRIPERSRLKIKKTIMSWSHNSKGKKLLNSMQTKQYVPIIDKDYDVVRQFLKEIKK